MRLAIYIKEILLLIHNDFYQITHCKKCVRKFLVSTVFVTVVLPIVFFLEMHYKLSIFSYSTTDITLIPEKLLNDVHAAVVYAVFQYAFPFLLPIININPIMYYLNRRILLEKDRKISISAIIALSGLATLSGWMLMSLFAATSFFVTGFVPVANIWIAYAIFLPCISFFCISCYLMLNTIFLDCDCVYMYSRIISISSAVITMFLYATNILAISSQSICYLSLFFVALGSVLCCIQKSIVSWKNRTKKDKK